MELRQQQRAFRLAVIGDGAAADLISGKAGDPLRRLQIYRHAYRSRLTDALAANYPALARALGDEAFAGLAAQYIDARPSRNPSIRWFGDALDDFVAHHDVLSHPALRDLLRLEWAICCAFDAADTPLATRAELARLAPEAWPALRLGVHPSVCLLDLDWNVEPIWQALTRDAETGVERALPEPVEHRHSLVVWREGLTPKWRSLDAVEAECLRALQACKTFEELCESAARQIDAVRAPACVAGWLQGWLADGLITRVGDVRAGGCALPHR